MVVFQPMPRRRSTSSPEAHFSSESQAFLAWLREHMRANGFDDNQSKLAAYLGTGIATVNGWWRRGALPRPDMCRELARVFKVPVEEVLRAAGHLPDESAELASEEAIIPELLVRLRLFTPEMQRRFALPAIDLAQRLSEETAEYEAGTPAQEPPPQDADEPPQGPPPG